MACQWVAVVAEDLVLVSAGGRAGVAVAAACRGSHRVHVHLAVRVGRHGCHRAGHVHEGAEERRVRSEVALLTGILRTTAAVGAIHCELRVEVLQ